MWHLQVFRLVQLLVQQEQVVFHPVRQVILPVQQGQPVQSVRRVSQSLQVGVLVVLADRPVQNVVQLAQLVQSVQSVQQVWLVHQPKLVQQKCPVMLEQANQSS